MLQSKPKPKPKKPKQVFISYSHDSDEHAECVHALADQLCEDGYDCIFDKYDADPPQGWTQWMTKGIEKADLVLLIFTQGYTAKLSGKVAMGVGKGCKWEGREIRNLIYDNDSINSKCLPVLFCEDDKRFILNLLGDSTHYLIDTEQGYQNLLRRLGGVHQAVKPQIGEAKTFKEITPSKPLVEYFKKPQAKIDLSAMPVTSGEIVGREQELALLEQAWAAPKTRIISFIAWGGVGKSSLLNKWLEQMDENDFKGAERVFAHSFYSQGTSDQRQVSAEHFINQAFVFLDYAGQIPSSPHQQGVLLAELFSQRKTLLILDGLEPMQHPLGDLEGRLKEQSLIAFLKNLAFSLNGLCVITSRVPVYELKNQSCVEYELERLSTAAGIALLRNNQIKGPKKSLAKAVEAVEGHALTLALLGSYLKTVYQGDIDKRDQMPALAGNRGKGKHAQKVMHSYHLWLAEKAAPELDILHILGLFDRPATLDAINVLKAEPAIAGVAERLQNLTTEDWAFAIENLRALNLIAKANPNIEQQDLDCHPLIREYFTQQLKDQNPTGFKAAHARLYEYYKNLPEKEFPDTLTELEPLFTAVAHGCLANMHQQALDEVYWPRIKRKGEHFTTRKLGAFGIDLACVACFFDHTWDKPARGLTDEDKAAALNWAGFRLRGLGRLVEAVAPFEASMKMSAQQKDWQGAAQDASNTSELYLTLGKLTQAQQFGEQSVTYADRSEDKFHRMSERTTWADALFQAGKLPQAKALFIEAEGIQQQFQPKFDILYSLQGFQFCALLLDLGEADKVIERAEKTLAWVTKAGWLLDIALDQLTLAQAHLQKVLKQGLIDFSQAENHLNQAVNGLRDAGTLHNLPWGLLTQATLFTHQNRHKAAWQSLDEVFESASHSQMLLHLTDYHLQACRNIHQQLNSGAADFIIIENGEQLSQNKTDMQARFSEHLTAAEALITDTGYHRRDKDLQALKA